MLKAMHALMESLEKSFGVFMGSFFKSEKNLVLVTHCTLYRENRYGALELAKQRVLEMCTGGDEQKLADGGLYEGEEQ